MRRILLVFVLSCLALAFTAWPAGASGATAEPADVESETVSVASHDEPASEQSTAVPAPCLLRSDCAGGGLLVGPPLLLLVPALMTVAAMLLVLGPAGPAPDRLHPRLLVARLERPPRPTS